MALKCLSGKGRSSLDKGGTGFLDWRICTFKNVQMVWQMVFQKDKSTKIPPFRVSVHTFHNPTNSVYYQTLKFFLILMGETWSSCFNLYFPGSWAFFTLIDHLNFFMKILYPYSFLPSIFSFSVYRCLLFWILILILLQTLQSFPSFYFVSIVIIDSLATQSVVHRLPAA